jgi:hypothetical protein
MLISVIKAKSLLIKIQTIVKMKSQLFLIVALMLGTALATPLDGASNLVKRTVR